jgi:hypothetical protein
MNTIKISNNNSCQQNLDKCAFYDSCKITYTSRQLFVKKENNIVQLLWSKSVILNISVIIDTKINLNSCTIVFSNRDNGNCVFNNFSIKTYNTTNSTNLSDVYYHNIELARNHLGFYSFDFGFITKISNGKGNKNNSDFNICFLFNNNNQLVFPLKSPKIIIYSQQSILKYYVRKFLNNLNSKSQSQLGLSNHDNAFSCPIDNDIDLNYSSDDDIDLNNSPDDIDLNYSSDDIDLNYLSDGDSGEVQIIC